MTDRDSNQKIANGNAKSMDEQTEDIRETRSDSQRDKHIWIVVLLVSVRLLLIYLPDMFRVVSSAKIPLFINKISIT